MPCVEIATDLSHGTTRAYFVASVKLGSTPNQTVSSETYDIPTEHERLAWFCPNFGYPNYSRVILGTLLSSLSTSNLLDTLNSLDSDVCCSNRPLNTGICSCSILITVAGVEVIKVPISAQFRQFI